MPRHLRTVTFGAILATAAAAHAGPATPLFSSEEPITITVSAPIAQLTSDRDETNKRDGTLTVGGETLPIRLNPRGITRREADVCDFPPLRVEFTSKPKSGLFAGQKSLKLITHCRNSPSHQQYVLLEAAAYRMYNVLTPLSFRTRLANVTYTNPQGRPVVTRVGFFLEDLDDVARRNDLKKVHEGDRVPLERLSAADGGRFALFEYFISNLDWSMRAAPKGEPCCHNGRLLQSPAGGAYVPVPYDFDFSGLVNAPYATPPAGVPVSSVRSRLYRGYCVHNRTALAAAADIRSKRAQLLQALNSTPGLLPATAQRAAAFLDPMWTQFATDHSVQSSILARCVN
ncbi:MULTISPECIES: hypothetical protein [Sphingomonas]|uniref:hypothetical protein n=1 Tax=Sphingomonas TaxID=13687 RepID=UPI000DEF3121|nr:MULTISPECIES: hypothetical protein [Sphingomonas]